MRIISLSLVLLVSSATKVVSENNKTQICYRENQYINDYIYRPVDSMLEISSVSCKKRTLNIDHAPTPISIPFISEYQGKGYDVIAHYHEVKTQVSGLIFIEGKNIRKSFSKTRPQMYFYDISGKFRCRGRFLELMKTSTQGTLTWYFDGSVRGYQCNRIGEIRTIENRPLSSH